jgi:hypothetical protein
MKPFTVFTTVFILASSILGWSQETPLPELLPKEARETFQKHAEEVARAELKLEDDLKLSIPDARVFRFLPKRGFRYLSALLNSSLYTSAGSTLFMPETERTIKSFSREEAIVGELLARAMVNRVVANQNACFHLLKELAPSPEAMRFEQQAKALFEKYVRYNIKEDGRIGITTEAEFLESLESIRMLFDQLRDLPMLTAAEFANERAESAVLAEAEYSYDGGDSISESQRKWPQRQLRWHRDWNHQGYILAFSESLAPDDYLQFQMVVNQRGGIFEWHRPPPDSHDRPDSYEAKLPKEELAALEDFLTKMPPSDASGEETHFIVSFMKDVFVQRELIKLFPLEVGLK